MSKMQSLTNVEVFLQTAVAAETHLAEGLTLKSRAKYK
jgi:hypothetical protein